jgi:hypothetical protein
MISEPHPGVRQMLRRMVARLGHEPFTAASPPTPAQLRSADVLLLEPMAPAGVSLARTARAANPAVAIVCSGIPAPLLELSQLEPNLAAIVERPLRIEQLDGAIRRALQHSNSLSIAGAEGGHNRATARLARQRMAQPTAAASHAPASTRPHPQAAPWPYPATP